MIVEERTYAITFRMQNSMMEVGRSLKPVTEVFLVHLMDKTLRHSTEPYINVLTEVSRRPFLKEGTPHSV